MKKILVGITCLIFLVFGFFFYFPRVTMYKHLLYVSGEEIVKNIGRDLQFCVEVDEQKYHNIQPYIDNSKVLGETYIYKNAKDVDALLSNFSVAILRRGYLNDKEIIYGYSSTCIYPSKTDSNVQICVDNDTVTIGFPIIYGEY